jgi:hypothetical protein
MKRFAGDLLEALIECSCLNKLTIDFDYMRPEFLLILRAVIPGAVGKLREINFGAKH